MIFLFAPLSAYLVGFLVTPILISFLKKIKLGDKPGGRKIHKNFTPSMGGIGFVLAAIVALSIWERQFPFPELRYILGAVSLVFFIGLRDDFSPLKATRKILGQMVAVSLVVVVSDIRIQDLNGFLGIRELNLFFSYAFSAFVILALTNAFNLIDGLDGLAGTSAAMMLGILGLWFLVQGIESYALLSFVFLGGVLAFLVYNWHPAKIFMGDTGSLTLGFLLGALIIAFMEANLGLPQDAKLKFKPVFSAGIALMIYPLYDMARVFTRRIRRGKGPMTPDKSHVHHFLMRSGLRHNQVTLILLGIQLAFIFLVYMLKNYSDNIVLPIISIFALLLGSRLNSITLKNVKKNAVNKPRILETRNLNPYSVKKVEIEKRDFGDVNKNLN